MPSFDDFYRAATGREPGDDGRLASTVLGWLWRRLHGSVTVGAATPRRLIYVLPQGSLLEPVAIHVGEWLTRAGVTDQVALYVVPGGADTGGPRWRRDMHRPAIVIGCADYLVSKALNHGFGTGPFSYPIDFALVTNGAQWVFDDVERCPRSASTIGELVRASAGRTAEPFAVTCLRAAPVRMLRADAEDFAAAVATMHQPGSRTLAVLNSVASATKVYTVLANTVLANTVLANTVLASTGVPCVLIHSYFRGRERQALAQAVGGRPGERGQIVVATGAAHAGIDADRVVAEPTGTPAPPAFSEGPRLPTMPELFDSAVPVAEFLDGPDLLEAQLIWATWTDPGPPPEYARLPADEWRCRALLAQIDVLAERALVWRFDRAQGGWTALSTEQQARPGEILLVAASDGGYDPALGFDPAIRAAVNDSPSADPVPASNDGGRWISLRNHSEETRDQAAALLAEAGPGLPDAARRAVVCAAYLHDLGKAHPTWQDALCAVAADDDREWIEAGRPWAKSGLEARLVFAGDVSFRHELASLLLIDGPLRALVDGTADRDLVRFLVLAHHGRLRCRIPDEAQASPTVIHGLEDGSTWPIPPVLDQPASKLNVELGWTRTAWTSTVGVLLDRYGPFTLAYLETLVRVADWRSSGGDPLATSPPGGRC